MDLNFITLGKRKPRSVWLVSISIGFIESNTIAWTWCMPISCHQQWRAALCHRRLDIFDSKLNSPAAVNSSFYLFELFRGTLLYFHSCGISFKSLKRRYYRSIQSITWFEARVQLKWNWNETERKQKGNRNSPETDLKQIWNSPETVLKQVWKRNKLLLANQRASFTISDLFQCFRSVSDMF